MQNVREGENTGNQHYILCPLCFLPCKRHESVILLGSVAKCLTRTPGVSGSSCNGPSVFFVGVSLAKTLQNPSLVLVKPRKVHEKCKCCRDMTKIPLKAA